MVKRPGVRSRRLLLNLLPSHVEGMCRVRVRLDTLLADLKQAPGSVIS